MENPIKVMESSLKSGITLSLIKEGVILCQRIGYKKIHWEIIEVMQDKFYATDADGFGSLFEFNEINNDWKFV